MFICIHRCAVYMEDKKKQVWNILADLEQMIDEMKQYMDEIAVEIDDGKKWEESE